MSAVSDEAIILQTFPYGDTSRILRLLTARHGLRSVMARGALRPRSRFGGVLEPFAEGIATLHLRDNRDLQTLTAFDLTRSPHLLGADLLRFAGASVLAEVVIRTGSEESQPDLFETVRAALERFRDVAGDALEPVVLSELWRLVDRLGFAPSLDACLDCGRPFRPDEVVRYDRGSGGARCEDCGPGAPGRDLPAHAREAILAFLAGRAPVLERRAAHWQLLRRHLEHHVVEGALRTFDFLESARPADPE